MRSNFDAFYDDNRETIDKYSDIEYDKLANVLNVEADVAIKLLRTRNSIETAKYHAIENGDWPKPEPLLSEQAREPYPVDSLSPIIKNAVLEVQDSVQAPIPLVAASALTTVSLASQAHINIERDTNLVGPASLYLLTLGDSGERKTSVDSLFTQPIRDFERRVRDEKANAFKEYTSADKIHKAKLAGIESKLKDLSKAGQPTVDKELQLKDLDAEKPKPPAVPSLLVADTTQEALLHKLGKKWPSGGIVSDEGGVVLGSHGMSSESAMRFMATLNALWNGSDQTIERKTSESFTVENPRLTVHLQVQSGVLSEFMRKNGALSRQSGLLARFLISEPESTQGTRPFKPLSADMPALKAFNHAIAQILNRPPLVDGRGVLQPSLMSLSPEANQVWIDYFNNVEIEVQSGREFERIRDVASKSAEQAARLAALFQYLESQTSATLVSVENMLRAVNLANWYMTEAKRFHGANQVIEEEINVNKLDEWLLQYCRNNDVDRVTRRDIQRRGPNPTRDKSRLDIALQSLVEHGRVRIMRAKKQHNVLINPALLD